MNEKHRVEEDLFGEYSQDEFLIPPMPGKKIRILENHIIVYWDKDGRPHPKREIVYEYIAAEPPKAP
jgi:hypothetical protein